ncbi:MAG: hypothetical protein OWQ57_10000 [Sulfobacillus sp.]|nr:hypothetical protein [Sulfobacillus sp.]
MSVKPSITLSRAGFAALLSLSLLGMASFGYALGLTMNRPVSTAGAAPSTPTPTPGGTPAATGPFVVGHSFPFQAAVETLSGTPTHLAHGSRATIVMAMASWCLFCSYEDKYVLPALAKTPGVAIDIVDVSPQGGIADPGPESPPFSGHDGTGGPLTLTGMEYTMRQYVATYGTLAAPNIHVYVAPPATQTAWNVQAFPTLAFVNAQGRIVVAPPGALTVSQAQSALQQTLQASPHSTEATHA